ncbi:MAG TPA: quinolinate synthase NadA [Candidatus Binatia bacterium]|nr:quinolinate synthase NadA [Candidatus Binatia bacterium]
MDATAEVREAKDLWTQFQRLGDEGYDRLRCAEIAALAREIRDLKRARRAVVLAHNYQRPEIFEVADFVGDSLELARKAATVEADIIVFCGVHFMAETAKILNPEKTVLLPNLAAGCSLADSITGEALAERREHLRKLYPDLAVVSYVNTTAEVKAESDVCCTSSNAARIVEALPNQNILFTPDENLAAYVQTKTRKNIVAWNGSCYVHHQIRPEHIQRVREAMPQVEVIAHPECRADVLALADAVLSTSGMIEHAKKSAAREFLVVTECGLSDRLLLELPEKKFYKACKLCQYMKMITLEETAEALRNLRYPIRIEEDVRVRAERAIRRMLELG